jgi:SPOR domain
VSGRARGGAGARPRRLVAAAVLAAPLCALGPVRPLRAQDNPAIRAAVQLAAGGQGDSARKLVALELARARPGDSAYVEALYWRGRLAASGDSAERDFRRVAIEYSNSRWADEALLQLSELALAAGNGAGALQLAERLRNDYPTSPLRARAALWAGRAAFEVGDPVTACALLDSAAGEASADVEFVNQVAFYRSRCAGVLARLHADSTTPAAPASAAPDMARRPAAAPEPPAPVRAAAPPPPSSFEVQVRATRSRRSADALLARLRQAGFKGRIVTGHDGLLRVRAGPFAGQHDADAAADRLRHLLGGHPFVVSPS